MRILRHRFGYLTELVDVILMLLLLCIPRTETFSCEDKSIGVESKGIISDNSFTASSYYNSNYKPYHARLLYKDHGWSPKNPQNDPNQYLEIDLGFEYFICAIATKAGKSSYYSRYVKTYKITMSLDKVNWTSYQEDGQTKIFTGNRDETGLVKQTLKYKPWMRYIRIYPIYYYKYKVIRVALYGYAKFEVCITNPLGMESGSIPDKNISASSSATDARLNSSSSWCPASSDRSPHLQIDLGSDYVICAIATQGNNAADQWVTSYYMSLSSDGNTWERYKENNSTDRIFYGNYDRSTVIKKVLYESTSSRYVRIEPKTNHGAPCLRIEIYGYQLQPTCTQHSVGVPSQFIIPDHRFTASSSYSNSYIPSRARLIEPGSWLTSINTNEFLEIDLNQIFRICCVLTQGDSSEPSWVTRYKIQFSRDKRHWAMYRELDGVDKEFQGNRDRATIVANSIKYPFKAKFVRLLPIRANRYIALRVDFKGTAEACTFPLGLENKDISDSQITSSSSLDSYHDALRARLYGSSSWCSLTTSNTEYIQVDLGQVKTVTGVALQGDPSRDKWVTKFIVGYGFSSGAWHDYAEGQVTKLFTGNSNRKDVVVNWLRRPIAARYVRILPRTSTGGRCLRFDLYGCDYVVTPIVTINTKQITIPSTKGSFQTLTCSLTGTPTPDVQWFHQGAKIANASRPSFPVKFNSAEHVVKYYSCTRLNPNKRTVTCMKNITCRATFPAEVPSGQPAEQTAQATVNLNVPKSPQISLSPQKRSLGVSWSSVVSDDIGSIKLYVIEFRNITVWISFNVQPFKRSSEFEYLKPYTNYAIRMRATSAVGVGMWSSIKTVQTLIAEPEERSVLYATPESSTKPSKYHGQITYADQDGTNLFKNVGNVRVTVLTKLKKYTRYAITISVGNTLYYGPESNIVNPITKEDVPSIAPRNICVSKINDTRFIVFWQPLTRKEANGIITEYKISWTLKHIRRTKRMPSMGEIFSKTTQGSQFVLSNLRLCAEYNVRVAGFTAAGAGPNATYTIITSKPDEPINLRSVEEGQTFITLKWEKPRGMTEDVKSYQIYLEGSKPTYWTSYSDSKKASRDGSKTTLKIDNLQPGTHYEFWVIVSTACGESNKSRLAAASTNIAKPVTPQGTVVILNDSLNITLWEVKPYNGPLSLYQVIVITNENQILKELPEPLNNYENAKKKDQTFYITAEIAPDQLKASKVFIIGDDKMYGIYKNVPLQKGGTYTIAERVITSHGGKRYSSDIAYVATIRLSPEPTKNAKSTSSSSVVGVTVGIVIDLLVVIIVLALVGFKYKRTRSVDENASVEMTSPPPYAAQNMPGIDLEIEENRPSPTIPLASNTPAEYDYAEIPGNPGTRETSQEKRPSPTTPLASNTPAEYDYAEIPVNPGTRETSEDHYQQLNPATLQHDPTVQYEPLSYTEPNYLNIIERRLFRNSNI